MGRALRLRVGANESNFGASPRARTAMREAADGIHCYLVTQKGMCYAKRWLRNMECTGVKLRWGVGIDDLLGLLHVCS